MRPLHVFGDICERVPQPVLDHLRAAQDMFRQRAEEAIAVAPRVTRRSIYSEYGDLFFEEACSFLDGVSIDPNVKCWCYVHEQYCFVKPCLSPNSRWVELGGNTCTPWTTSGVGMGHLSPVSVAAIVWAYSVKDLGPHHVINECSAQWPALRFWHRVLNENALAPRKIRSMLLNPLSLGAPANRARRYTHIAAASEKVRFGATRDHVMLAVGCTTELKADDYFVAPPDALARFRAELMRDRGFLLPPGVTRIKWDVLLPRHYRARLRRWRNFLRIRNIDVDDPQAYVCDIQHNPEYVGRAALQTMPALQRTSYLYNLKRKRVLIPMEHFIVNGLPVFSHHSPVPLSWVESLSGDEVRGLAGNMMHVAVVGSLLGYIVLDAVNC